MAAGGNADACFYVPIAFVIICRGEPSVRLVRQGVVAAAPAEGGPEAAVAEHHARHRVPPVRVRAAAVLGGYQGRLDRDHEGFGVTDFAPAAAV